MKAKYNLMKRFKYNNSKFLQAVMDGEWVLLDGIENAPSFIAEKISFLCGEKPELNLYEKDTETIKPKEGFHLFITYNPERINPNSFLTNSLLDKCLVYNLNYFINDPISTSQIIYGFLVNTQCITDKNILYEISSRLANISRRIKEKMKNNNNYISERSIINYCKTLNYKSGNLPLSLKENYLYYYFPFSDKKEREIFIDIINKNIQKKTELKYKALATHYKIECKEPLSLLSYFEKEKNECQIFPRFLTDYLNVPIGYIEKFKSSIIKFRNIMKDKLKSLICNIFIDYLDKINISLQTIDDKILNDTKIRENTNFPCIKKLILFEELNKKNLFSWNWLNILYKKHNFYDIIENMHLKQDINSLIQFFKEIIDKIRQIR